MPLDFTTALGVHEHALAVRSQRMELLASNLANADTPGYKARDVNFQAAMAQAESSLQPSGMARTNQQHLLGAPALGMDNVVQYRIPTQPSLDGNTVDSQAEKTTFARNAMDYQASLTLLNGSIRNLMTAIRGD